MGCAIKLLHNNVFLVLCVLFNVHHTSHMLVGYVYYYRPYLHRALLFPSVLRNVIYMYMRVYSKE